MADTAVKSESPRAADKAAQTQSAILKHLRFICLNGDIHDFHKFVVLHPTVDLNDVVDVGRDHTPLMLACDNPEAAALVRILVEDHNVDVNTIKSERLTTPLHIACRAGSNESAMILIDNGADVNVPDLVGRTPLHLACLGSSLSVMKSIVRRAGAVAINQTDHSDYTPLMYAAEYDRPEVAEFLIACGATKAAKNKLSHTASELADWYGHFSVLKTVDEEAWSTATKALETQKKKQQAKAASEAAKDASKEDAASRSKPDADADADAGATAAASASSAAAATAGASSSSSSSASPGAKGDK